MPTSTRHFGAGTQGHAEQIQTGRCQACHTTCSARLPTPLSRLKTASHQVAVVLMARASWLDASAARRVFGSRQATLTTWVTRALEHAKPLPERAHLASSSSRTSSWTNGAPDDAAPHQCCGGGWLSTLARRCCPSSIWAPARSPWRIGSGTPCDRSWPPFWLPLCTSEGFHGYL